MNNLHASKILIGITLFLLLSPFYSKGQQYDNNWIAGMHEYPGLAGYNNAIIRFNGDTAQIIETDLHINFESTLGVMSDSIGKLLFFTNGCYIATASGDTMPGGETINPGEIHDWVCGSVGYICPRGALALPMPAHKNQYVLLHMGARYDPVRKIRYGPFYYSSVDMSLGNGNGIVTNANSILADGDFEPFTAVRHGNGRDWWVIVPEFGTNHYTVFLLNPDGLQGPFIQTIGPDMDCRRIGSCTFSQQGTKFARVQNCLAVTLDFDRCTGQFSNPVSLTRPAITVGGGGLAFSPDGNRLLTCSDLQIFEADLTQSVPQFDTAFIWDYQWGVSLQHMQYAPNGTIWLNHVHRTPYFSTITQPDLPGVAMKFKSKGIALPVYTVRTLPNFPNFRLYDWPDSPCDTLGINAPVSSVNQTTVGQITVKTYPNPISDYWVIEDKTSGNAPRILYIFDITGNQIYRKVLLEGEQRVSVPTAAWPIGFYCWILQFNDGTNVRGKIIKS